MMVVACCSAVPSIYRSFVAGGSIPLVTSRHPVGRSGQWPIEPEGCAGGSTVVVDGRRHGAEAGSGGGIRRASSSVRRDLLPNVLILVPGVERPSTSGLGSPVPFRCMVLYGNCRWGFKGCTLHGAGRLGGCHVDAAADLAVARHVDPVELVRSVEERCRARLSRATKRAA